MSLRRTPYYDVHVQAGGRMVPFAGFEMPVQYSGVIPEHLRVRESVGLFDVSHMGEVRVKGPGALKALQRLLSNDVSVTIPGQAQYNTMPNEQGGVVDDVVVYRIAEDEFLVCVNADNREKDFAWMTSHNEAGADAVFTDEGDQWAQLAIQGRNARNVMAKLTEVPLDPIGTYRFAIGRFAGVEGCIIARTGYTGEDGFEVFIPVNQSVPVWKKILDAGAEYGILPIGLGARDTLRLEVRYCLYGHELNDETSPLQAGLGWVTKADKPGGFIGRDAIVARKAKDERKLVGLVVADGRIARDGMAVFANGEEVGRITSGTKSPSTGKAVALAYVRPDLTKAGTKLEVDVRGKRAEAEVVAGPFYKRNY
jgi:aminomethyltransferase